MVNNWINFCLQKMAASGNICKSLKGLLFLTHPVFFHFIVLILCQFYADILWHFLPTFADIILFDFVASALSRSWRRCSWKRNRSRSSVTCCCWHCWVRSLSPINCCLNCTHLPTADQHDSMFSWCSIGHCVNCCFVSLGWMTRCPTCTFQLIFNI